MVVLSKGDYVWVDSSIGVPIGARVKVTDGEELRLLDDEGKELRVSEVQRASIRHMHPTSVEGVDDMIKLGDLTEAGVLRNLLVRHKQGIIYTYIGSVLVAVNPYQLLPIYTAEQVRLYHGRKLGELPPHVFAIADKCYYNLLRNQRNQCCVISGESGAGKTESTKLILQFLAAVSGQHSWIEQQILQANPVLEAFGNAKTTRNDNSSRFGKYVEIFFNKDGIIEGAHIEQYLLEKSRVCHQAPMERNYHIFYCLLSGMAKEQKNILALGDATQFNYLTEGDCITCDGQDDADEFGRIRTALKVLTFTDRESWEIFCLLAAILHLGNISFEAGVENNMESCDVMSSDHFTIAAKLLEVDKLTLDLSLTHRSFVTNRERLTKPLSSEQAIDCRDALAKAIYSRLFMWIFGKINSAIHKHTAENSYTYKSIGLLDIFGFENFDKNSFEQMCINYANEQLQQFFVEHIFKLEQEEYLKEGIKWKNINFTDNQLTIDLLAVKPLNILSLIDEESHFPKGTDKTLLDKIKENHKRSKIMVPSRNIHSMQFGIKHFAGVVFYDCSGFLEKNRDALSLDIISLIQKSSSKLLRLIFQSELNASVSRPAKNNNSRVLVNSKRSLQQGNDRRQISTLSGQFRHSLDSLMKALSLCEPFFIRCFKPNDSKQSNEFDRKLCIQQLRYSGLLETIKIRKLGYPIRHRFTEFLGRYRVLLKTTDCDPNTEPAADCCDAICRAVIKDEDDWRIGKTKIFLRDYHDSFLELERERELNRKALIIQRVLLGHRDRKTFIKKKSAALTLQKHWRGHRDRKQIEKLLQGFLRLQATVHGRQDVLQFQRTRGAVVTLQSQTRGFLSRKELKCKQAAVIVLQSHTRGLLARKQVRRLRDDAVLSAQEKEAQELADLERQRRLEEVLSQSQEEDTKTTKSEASDEEIEGIFGFLPKVVGGQEGPAPEGFEDLEGELVELKEVQLNENKEEEEEEEKKEEKGNMVKIVVTPADEIVSSASPSEKEEEEEEEDDEEDEFSFSKFSALHFQGSATHTHIDRRLQQPLIHHEDEGDTLACVTVWWIILRFMGDIPEPKQARLSVVADTIQKNLGMRQARRLSNLVGVDEKFLRKKAKQQGKENGKRKHSTIPEELTVEPPELDFREEDDVMIGEGPTFDRPMTPLEKLHTIVGYAIVKPDIRDEIYCQICKQLTKNPNPKSCSRGWVLLSICLGIFPPTELFTKYLENFIRRGRSEYSANCAERLQRTLRNGERNEPPCWIELRAVEKNEHMVVVVTLMDGQTLSLPVDSACTSAELCQSIAQKTNLKDTFGFSLYIALYEKIWSLGCGGEHILDAISQCEQEERRQGREEQHSPWRLYFRKELFTPWHDCTTDPFSTELIYRQLIHGLKNGDYQSDKEDDYVQLAAKHYYIQYGSESSVETARKVVRECMSLSLIESKSEGKLVQLVKSAHAQGAYVNSRDSADAVKADMVAYARLKWPLYFSRFFEASQISGPPLPEDQFVVAVNWSGVSFQAGKDRTFLQLSYPELTGVQILSEGRTGEVVCMSTLRGEYKLKAVKAHSMVELITIFLEGLKERSVYAVTMQDITRQDDATYLSCKKGDLLCIINDGEYSKDGGWIKGQNERTGQSGAVSTDAIMILPTMSRPSDEILTLLSPGPKKSVQVNPVLKDEVNVDRVALVSLKEYSTEFFREANRDAGKHGKGGKEKLWAKAKEPLKHPLLKSLQNNSELSQLACLCFSAILKYMGDYPIKNLRTPIELTDQIYGPALEHPELRDEVYCQIMKQMTSNNNGISLERGWQLLWLCCGLFPPSQGLLKHAQKFLNSRSREPLSAACLQRMQGMLRIEARKFPPHQVEVDAIQQNSSQIFHKVHFPNDTREIFEVTTTTRIRDLCRNIANYHSLSSADGYSLFVKTANKVVGMNEQQYFFDNLKQYTDAPKKGKKSKEGTSAVLPYLVLFMRKLWFNVMPGKDITADLVFHFPQELPKYLRGYHTVSKEEMVNLAGLLFRVKVDTDRSQFVMIPKMLKDLVPADQLKIMSSDDWKKHIINAYNKQAGITVDEAKVSFLRTISVWPTFGCAFFEVKQTSERSYPSIIQIAISKQGLTLSDPKNKEVLVMYPFSKITNWSSGNTYFHMTIGSLVKGNTLLCETSLGYKIDDLLNSYVNMYLDERTNVRPRNQLPDTSRIQYRQMPFIFN
ncbi:unconventional myosin-VIIb [Astyanax mexicanus]|uniref:unconventional myosin-VIIb n=1 Tax=Astyanax mexicanus TaxID=7994 RepID=UPI0020CABB1C|nr:unconventional myosin-VIIb [Astyanax mexicanus]